MRTLVLLATLLVLVMIHVPTTLRGGSAAHAEESERRHASRPLAVREFQGDRGDAPERFLAYTETQLRYSIRYQHQSDGRTTSAWLSSAEIYAVFLPELSWWDTERGNRKLLAHEQGHFDITEALALEFQLEIAKQIATGKALLVTAKDAKTATDALQAKFAAMQQRYESRLAKEQKRYDRVTSFGTNITEQVAERLRQLESLRKLSRALKELE